MRDKADVWFVYSHPEGNRSDYNNAFFSQEAGLIFCSFIARDSRVIRKRFKFLSFQPGCYLINFVSGEAIDDARFSLMLVFQKPKKLLLSIFF